MATTQTLAIQEKVLYTYQVTSKPNKNVHCPKCHGTQWHKKRQRPRNIQEIGNSFQKKMIHYERYDLVCANCAHPIKAPNQELLAKCQFSKAVISYVFQRIRAKQTYSQIARECWVNFSVKINEDTIGQWKTKTDYMKVAQEFQMAPFYLDQLGFLINQKSFQETTPSKKKLTKN